MPHNWTEILKLGGLGAIGGFIGACLANLVRLRRKK